jgi:hypothetical protein
MFFKGMMVSLMLTAAPLAMAQAMLEVRTDLDCTLNLNGLPQGQLLPAAPFSIQVGAGLQRIECSSAAGTVRREVNIVSSGLTTVALRPSLLTRYVANADGTLTDDLTKMQWTIRDNGADISWIDADRYCRELDLAGTGWRLPSVTELEQIHDPSGTLTTPCADTSCEISPQFQLSGSSVWSSDLSANDNTLAWYLALHQAGRGSASLSAGSDGRALCMRPLPPPR